MPAILGLVALTGRTLVLLVLVAALVILAAAGPLWNPPTATTNGAMPIALLIDDGFSAAASWDARIRTADDLIARAEADNRGIALVPLSEAGRDISMQTPAAARVAVGRLKPKPHAIERVDALPGDVREKVRSRNAEHQPCERAGENFERLRPEHRGYPQPRATKLSISMV